MKLNPILMLLVVRGAAQPGPPHTLLAEYWPSPAIGVGVARPRFSWTLPPGPPGQASAGYRVIVRRASTGAVAWDSQQVASGASNQVECGVSLLSDTHYSWQVQWWPAGQASRPSALSNPAELQIGLLSPADWQGAEPIRTNYSGPAINNGPAELMRSEFVVDRAATSAVLYVSAVGWAQAYLNGAEVAPSDRLNPGRTSFDVRQWYLAYNVTKMLKPGNNTVGILLGQGWQSMAGAHYPVGRLMLSIANSTGGRSYVYTSGSGSWLGSRQGPIQQNNIYLGESYNGTMELNGWAANGFDAGSWQPCTKWDEFTQHKYQLAWQPMPPIRALELNPPTRFWPVALSDQTVYVYEFPQNAAGWARLNVKGCARGQVVTMYFGEVLCGRGTTRWSPACPAGQAPGEGKPGTIDQRNLHGNWHNTYVCKGEPEEVYEPSFMYTGHRFVELHGHPGAPTSGTLTQRVVHSDVEPVSGQAAGTPRVPAGSIAFGSELAPEVDGSMCYEGEGCTADRPGPLAPAVLDQISHNVRWTLIDNLHSVPEDCDQRNERWGWMADASVSSEGNFYYHNIGSLYSGWLTLMRDVQTETDSKCAIATGTGGDSNVNETTGKASCAGAVGDLTPGTTPAALPGDPSWMFAYPLVFSYQHRYMADSQLAAKLWPGIREYANFLKTMADRGHGKTKGLLTWNKYGDWLEPGRVPSLPTIGAMSSGFNYGQTIRIARDTARVLNYTEDAEQYELAYERLKQAYHAAWWDQANKTYGNGQQTALVYALYLGAVPQNLTGFVFKQLLALIGTTAQPPDHAGGAAEQCGKPPCLDTGILATKWLMELLSLNGRTDVGLDLVFQTDYPSWGYMAAQNATTVWEHWEYMNGPGMNSHNHPALASVGAWLYRWVAGLRLDDGTVWQPDYSTYGQGFRHVLFAPGCVTDKRLQSASARATSLYGQIEVGWRMGSGNLTMTLSLPTNTFGRVVVPSVVDPGTSIVTVGGHVVWLESKFLPGMAAGVLGGSQVDGSIVLQVGSGSYSLVASL